MLCFSVIPLAAIASLAVHILIQYEQIRVIDDSSKDDGNIVKTIETIQRKNIPVSHGSF